ncbi:unnamed protein product, partial [Rotaria sp. Silwood2]
KPIAYGPRTIEGTPYETDSILRKGETIKKINQQSCDAKYSK